MQRLLEFGRFLFSLLRNPHLPGGWICAGLLLLAMGCRGEAPTGITRADLEGVWRGAFANVSLLGRTLSGDVDWQFDRNTFELRFFDPPPDQAERIAGDWKFARGKVVLTLKTSFPIGSDAGATDSLFVSILGNEISIQTSGGSNILLRKAGIGARPDTDLYREALLSNNRGTTHMLVKIEAYHDGEFWCARGIGEDIFTQGRTFDELIGNIKEAVALHFEDTEPLPEVLLLSEVKLDRASIATG